MFGVGCARFAEKPYRSVAQSPGLQREVRGNGEQLTGRLLRAKSKCVDFAAPVANKRIVGRMRRAVIQDRSDRSSIVSKVSEVPEELVDLLGRRAGTPTQLRIKECKTVPGDRVDGYCKIRKAL